MNTQHLPAVPVDGHVQRALAARRHLAIVVTSASAMLAGLAVGGYTLGTAHALQRTLAQGHLDGV